MTVAEDVRTVHHAGSVEEVPGIFIRITSMANVKFAKLTWHIWRNTVREDRFIELVQLVVE